MAVTKNRANAVTAEHTVPSIMLSVGELTTVCETECAVGAESFAEGDRAGGGCTLC
jgi:hypothetical protein